jgi:NhaP-type Na+/H+ or K+/H+ antiporter
MNDPAVQIAALVVAAVVANWLADHLRIPSILPLLAVGLLAGPILGWLDPDALFGDLLTPMVAVAVGVILFEGGLTLRHQEIDGSQRVIWALVTVGAVVTWVIASATARIFLDVGWGMAVVLGSILVVSGPTVVGPVLQTVRPSRQVGSILKWESIFVDPVGAMLAVIAFDAVIAGRAEVTVTAVAVDVALFALVGSLMGIIVAAAAVFALRRHWIPEHLISLFGLASALVAFTAADVIVHESGLLATTVVGLTMANHRRIRTEPMVRFSEVLRVLLIGGLFIILSARLTRDQLSSIGWGVAVLITVLVFVARPAATWLSTIGSGLELREKALIAGVAPRGIVAASIASVFGVELEHAGVPGAALLTPVTFAVIIATVLIYGLGAGPLARALGLARRGQEGALILGAGPVERAIAEALVAADVDVVVATINRNDERLARMAGLRTFYGNVLDDEVDLRLEMSGIGRLLALTPNDEVNTLAARRFTEVFGGAEVFQVSATPPPPGVDSTMTSLGGRELFGPDWDYRSLLSAIQNGGVRRTQLSKEFDRVAFFEHHGPEITPLIAVRDRRLIVNVVDAPTRLADRLAADDVVLWLGPVPPDE